MLIIFDLDDTLIDSFGCSQPVKWKLALEAMIKAGLKVDFDSSYKLLMEINETSINGKEALKKFLKKINNKDEKFFQIDKEIYYGGEQLDFPINPLPEAIEVLNELKNKHDLVLISHGVEEEQYNKMKKANIKKESFKKIIITKNYNKKEYYNDLMKEFNCPPEKVLVIGDKFETDLLPAKELNMNTVHILWGRGKAFPPEPGQVDFVISDLREILNIVKELQ